MARVELLAFQCGGEMGATEQRIKLHGLVCLFFRDTGCFLSESTSCGLPLDRFDRATCHHHQADTRTAALWLVTMVMGGVEIDEVACGKGELDVSKSEDQLPAYHID